MPNEFELNNIIDSVINKVRIPQNAPGVAGGVVNPANPAIGTPIDTRQPVTPAPVPNRPFDITPTPGLLPVPAAPTPTPGLTEFDPSISFERGFAPDVFTGERLNVPTTPTISPLETTAPRELPFGPTVEARDLGAKQPINWPQILGMLASAIGPETVGGRLGKGVVGLTQLDEATRQQAVKEGMAREELDISRLSVEAKGTEAVRKGRVGQLFSELSTLGPESPEYAAKIGELQQTATPQELGQLGLVPKAVTPQFKPVETSPGVWEWVDVTSGPPEVPTGIPGAPAVPGAGVGLRAPTPVSEAIKFGKLIPTVDALGNITYTQPQVSGPGVGGFEPTGLGVPPASDLMRELAKAEQSLIEKNKALSPDKQVSMTVENITKERLKLFPKGKGKGTFAARLEEREGGEAELTLPVPSKKNEVITPNVAQEFFDAAEGVTVEERRINARKLAIDTGWRLK